jgi:hypothetical protein
MSTTTSPARSRKPTALSRQELVRRYGFYAPTFTPEELRHLDEQPDARPEFMLLRTKILRLAKLTPLTKIDEQELDALIKLVRVVAALDAMERTSVMARKAEGAQDPVLEALAGMDAEDL